ncbi:DUF6795 domain-containing protein [Marinobacter sp.]|uniref:DUF6795 domain-containing protein n=1 Tax=Marinobacter sp. TaxID=50741 RepID=UPI003A9011E0
MSKKSHSLLLPPAIALLFLAGMVIPHEANAGMFDLITQFFKKYDVHLSPEVHGSVRNNGVPLENVEVYRSLDYDKNYGETTRTDSNGQFSFPEKVIRSRRPGQLFDETRIRQVIGLVYEGEKYLLWYLTDEFGPHRAVAEKLAALNCDLTTPEMEFAFSNYEHPSFSHAAFSICRWD